MTNLLIGASVVLLCAAGFGCSKVTDKLKKGTTSEAAQNLKAIARGAESYYMRGHSPPGAMSPIID